MQLLPVKNTFIEFQDGREDDGAELATGSLANRQVSEPAAAANVPAPAPYMTPFPEEGVAADRQGANVVLESGSSSSQYPVMPQQMGLRQEQHILERPGTMPAMVDNPNPDGQVHLPPDWAATFTVMMRNLPNRYTQLMLLEEISSAGFAGFVDFLYLPIDPDTNANKGYAFINFLDPTQAWRFKNTYEGQQMKSFNSSKFVSVSPAALQGLEANYAHYSTTRCNRGNPSSRPLFLRIPQQTFTSRSAERRGGQRRSFNARGSAEGVAAQRGESMLQPQQQPQQQQPQQQQQQQERFRPPGPEQPRDPPRHGNRFCPYCGGRTWETYRFCTFCGASLEGLEVLLGPSGQQSSGSFSQQ